MPGPASGTRAPAPAPPPPALLRPRAAPGPGPVEPQQVLDNDRGPLDPRLDLLRALPPELGVVGILQQELGGRRADGQGVSNLVGDPSGQDPQRRPFLALEQLR